MGLTTKQRHLAQLNEEIRDPKTTPVTFRKRCRTLLELYPSRRHSTFINQHILARLLSDDLGVREAAEKFQKEIINKNIRDFSLRRRQLVASERQKLGIDPKPEQRISQGPPPGATMVAPDGQGRMHYTNDSGEDLGLVEGQSI